MRNGKQLTCILEKIVDDVLISWISEIVDKVLKENEERFKLRILYYSYS